MFENMDPNSPKATLVTCSAGALIILGLAGYQKVEVKAEEAFQAAHPAHLVLIQFENGKVAYTGAQNTSYKRDGSIEDKVTFAQGTLSFQDACAENTDRKLTGTVLVKYGPGPARCDNLPMIGTPISELKK